LARSEVDRCEIAATVGRFNARLLIVAVMTGWADLVVAEVVDALAALLGDTSANEGAGESGDWTPAGSANAPGAL
jgi:hypothetical protein